jgi:gliding motility-associated-like protein
LCAGTYHVIATSDIGCSDTATVTITSTSAPTVNVTSQTICQGTSASLTATGSPAGGTFSWSPGGLTNASITISPATTTNYTVTYTLAGCSANATGTVTVNPLPAPIITGTTTYCAGSNVSLSTTTPFTSYSWSTGSSAATINATAANNPLTVTVTNAAGCQATSPAINLVENGVVNANSAVSICQGESMLIHGVLQSVAGTYSQTFTLASGCDSTSNVTLTVNPLPTIDAGLDQTICAGTSVTLTASGGVNYTWDNGVTNGLAFNPSVSTTYTVLGTNAAGCVASDQVLVTVNPLPSIDAGPDQQLCAGTSVQLTASGASAFTWDNGIVDGVSFVPVSTTTYTVTGTSVDGCVKSDQVTVTVNPLPTVFAGNDISICSGQSITLSGQGATSYSWDNGVQNGVPFIPTLGTSTYTVTGTSAAGCIASDDVLVSVGATSTVSFLTDTTSGCSPLPVNLTNTTAGASNCVWTLSDGTILSGCGTVSTSLLTPGCYDVTLTSTFSNGCVGTLTMPNLICVDPNPIASFTPSTTTITEENSTVYLHNTSSNASDYLWDFGDHLSISTAIDPTHDYGQDALGNYLITLVAYSPAGCTDTAFSLIRYEEDLIFYVPNAFTPDDDEFNQLFQPVFTSGFDPFDFSMLIFNRWGEIVFETHDATIGWDGTYGANSQNRLAEDGTYTWKIEFKTSKNDERKLVVGHVNMLH